MTFEEFNQRRIDDAVKAVFTNSSFSEYFIRRICNPSYSLREWEEEVVIQFMALSSSGQDGALSRRKRGFDSRQGQ